MLTKCKSWIIKKWINLNFEQMTAICNMYMNKIKPEPKKDISSQFACSEDVKSPVLPGEQTQHPEQQPSQPEQF